MKITLNLEEVRVSEDHTVSEQNAQSPGKSELVLVNQEYYARPPKEQSGDQTIPRNEDV
jgi:hypothetical protein